MGGLIVDGHGGLQGLTRRSIVVYRKMMHHLGEDVLGPQTTRDASHLDPECRLEHSHAV